ncbi:MAG: hypothetical protein P8Z38_13090, partial [Robiginitalea sp.]
ILIALQVDNWNEERLARRNELVVAQDIYLELLENREYLDETLEMWKQRREYIRVLSNTLVSENRNVKQKVFDSLLSGSLSFGNFSPKRNKLDRVLSSEIFEFGQSKAIIREMMNLSGLYDDLNEYFDYNVDTWKQIVQPYLISNYSFRNLNSAFLGDRQSRKDFKIDHNKLLADPVFDNIVENMQGDVNPFIRLLERSLENIDELTVLLESSFPKIETEFSTSPS